MRASIRDELVQRATQVFYQRGFHATGMDTLVAETGVSKTAMYKHFRTKDDLILAVLRFRDETLRNWLFRRMEELGQTPESQLLALFDALDEWIKGPGFQGCLFIKASSEFQDAEHPIYLQSAEHKRLLRRHFRALATTAGVENADLLANQLLLLKEGAIVSAHMKTTQYPAEEARQAAGALLSIALRK
ncbi:TetR/AcrR family transcriptional regulator [Kordiimonas aquimaris]|uniref:TetR/AcrR family transcriptional regulator n=1 Tax=Kordiimonas aquimaris TaxID=707591 RepID=UPI0021CF15E0|nr:TetR family transcriptional regulator [Kordiimonas aquimaris]